MNEKPRDPGQDKLKVTFLVHNLKTFCRCHTKATVDNFVRSLKLTLLFILTVLADVAGGTIASEAVEPVDAGAAVQAGVAVALVDLGLAGRTFGKFKRGSKSVTIEQNLPNPKFS